MVRISFSGLLIIIILLHPNFQVYLKCFIDDANPKDPREKPVPPRPKGQRPEPESTGGPTFGGFGGFGGGGKFIYLVISTDKRERCADNYI